MKATTTLIFAIALTVTLTVTLIMKGHSHQGPRFEDDQAAALRQPKRVSRFLAANEQKLRNPNAADHCHKDSSACQLTMPLIGRNATCCNNKCVDLHYDSQNCGACKNKCCPFEMCCQGECVNLSYDKRHCDACNNACRKGPESDAVCVYAMCGYA